MSRLTYKDYEEMEEDLKIHRARMIAEGVGGKDALVAHCPIRYSYLLFNTANTFEMVNDLGYSCELFGYQLVHKIIDELIDCGLERR